MRISRRKLTSQIASLRRMILKQLPDLTQIERERIILAITDLKIKINRGLLK